MIDVYAALQNQFYWADRVIVNPAAAEPEVLEGEIVASQTDNRIDTGSVPILRPG